MKPDAIRSDTQFSVFLVNKPGILARVCQQLADDKVNILAMSMMDSQEHGVLRMVTENPGQARKSLSELEVPRPRRRFWWPRCRTGPARWQTWSSACPWPMST